MNLLCKLGIHDWGYEMYQSGIIIDCYQVCKRKDCFKTGNKVASYEFEQAKEPIKDLIPLGMCYLNQKTGKKELAVRGALLASETLIELEDKPKKKKPKTLFSKRKQRGKK